LLLPSIEKHKVVFGHPPALVAADAAFFSAENEKGAEAAGVKRVAIPSRATKSAARRERQRSVGVPRGATLAGGL
jgi:IS5 family transposase